MPFSQSNPNKLNKLTEGTPPPGIPSNSLACFCPCLRTHKQALRKKRASSNQHISNTVLCLGLLNIQKQYQHTGVSPGRLLDSREAAALDLQEGPGSTGFVHSEEEKAKRKFSLLSSSTYWKGMPLTSQILLEGTQGEAADSECQHSKLHLNTKGKMNFHHKGSQMLGWKPGSLYTLH